MKMQTLAASVFAIGMLSAVPATVSAVPLSLTFSPVSQNTTVGGNAAVDIIATLDNQILAGFDLRFSYNPVFVQLSSFTSNLTPFGGAANSFSATDMTTTLGQVDFSIWSTLTDEADIALLQQTSFTLAHLEFKGLAAGTSPLSFDFSNPNLFVCVGYIGEEIDCGAGRGSITVTGDNGGNDVPEPMSGALVFTALGALALARRYRS